MIRSTPRKSWHARLFAAFCAVTLCATPLAAAVTGAGAPISLSIRNADITEVFEMLSRAQRANVLLTKDVTGSVSVNLYDIDFEAAVRSVAEAAGFAVELRDQTYVVLKRDDVGKNVLGGTTEIRSFKIQYTDPAVVAEILEKHLSRFGQITTLSERGLLVVEDLPGFLNRVDQLLQDIDVQPQQILIEAKVLEITLEDSEVFGLDWKAIFSIGDGDGTVGTRGFTSPISSGFFFTFINDNLEMFLDALTERGRVRTLSSPKLLALENREAEVLIGERLGYKVTTTINQVTSESVEYLDSGVILRVLPSVDESGRIVLEIHPEVSTGIVVDGIPNQTTTEVTTQLVAEDGQTIFIGGLIKDRTTRNHSGVPLLGSIPVLGRLFSRDEDTTVNTETVVLITPHIVTAEWWQAFAEQGARVDRLERELQGRGSQIDRKVQRVSRIDDLFSSPEASDSGFESSSDMGP